MNNQKFFRCTHCGNFVGLINNAGVPMICCGVPMVEQVPNLVDADNEKHVPVVKVTGDNVDIKVGSVLHPMTNEHHIEFVYIQTSLGGQRRSLLGNSEAVANFKLAKNEKVLQAFAYCNIHGLWKTVVEKDDKVNEVAGWFKQKPAFEPNKARELATKLGINFANAKFTEADFLAGMYVELEHGLVEKQTNVTNDDPLITAKIALAHLNENPLYYDKKVGIEAWEHELDKYKNTPITNKKIKIILE